MEGTRLFSQAGLLERLRTPYSAYRKGKPPFGEYEEARYLPSGDRYLLVEFGDRLNIIINCKALAFEQEIKKSKIPGILETCVGQLAVLIFYDDSTISFDGLVAKLKEIEKRISMIEQMVLPSRLIEIPVLFHDRWTIEAAGDYSAKMKPVEDNCEVVIKYNGLKDLKELIEYTTTPQHWVANMGWMPGNANGFPLDPRYEIRAPKYNPSRTWTPQGTLGVGTADKVIYPLRSPGGYQMIGRTPVKMYEPEQQNPAFKRSIQLARVGDRIRFYPIVEEEYFQIEKEVQEGIYRYRITSYDLFSVRKYLEFLEDVREESERELKKRPWAGGHHV
jgi:urea carboxylase